MSFRLTKIGLEVVGRPHPLVSADGTVNTVYPFVSEPNWRGEITDETIWQTGISRSKESAAEERESRVSRPTRTGELLVSGMDRAQTSRILANAFQSCKNPTAVPLCSDFSVVTVAGTTTIGCDTTYRRIYVGQRIMFVPSNFGLTYPITGPTQAQIGVVASKTNTSITLVSALSVSVAINDIVFPLVDCETSLSQNISALTDGLVEWRQTYTELAGASTLPFLSSTDLGYLVNYFQGLPVWDGSYNWRDSVDVNVIREGSSVQSGNTNLISVDGANPLLQFNGTYEFYDRKSAWKAARFFDGRRGRCLPFWAVNPVDMFELLSIDDSDTIHIRTFTNDDNMGPFLETIALVDNLGNINLYRVDTYSSSGSSTVVNLLDTITDTGMIVEHATSAHLCRFDQDNLKRTWLSDGICKMTLAHRSLQKEGVYVLD